MSGSKDDAGSGGSESSGGFLDGIKDKLRDTKLHDAKISLMHRK
jgi:hypothetical protein